MREAIIKRYVGFKKIILYKNDKKISITKNITDNKPENKYKIFL